MNRSERFVPYLFLLPALLGLLLFEFLPVLYSLGRSLYAVSFGLDGGGLIFVGLDNFRSLFTDPVFWNSLKVTLIFNVVLTPLQVILALALALLVNVPVRGVGIFRGLFFIPVGVSLTVTSLIWSLMLDSQSGLLNGILAPTYLLRDHPAAAAPLAGLRGDRHDRRQLLAVRTRLHPHAHRRAAGCLRSADVRGIPERLQPERSRSRHRDHRRAAAAAAADRGP